MNLQQLRYFCAVVEHQLNVSRTARALHTAQPGISNQIGRLEDELGVDLLVRRGNRLVGITEPGQIALGIARRILRDSLNLKLLGEEFTKKESGMLIVAATYIHARYWLPPIILAFNRQYPNVHLDLLRAEPSQVVEMVSANEAHVGICTSTEGAADELVTLPCHKLERSIICPPRHPLLKKKRITHADIARYPFVMQTTAYSGGWQIKGAFEARGIKLNIILGIADPEVAKVCIEQGIGITVLPTRVFDPKRDRGLRAIDVSHLFEPMQSYVVLHQNYYLRGYAYDFIEMFAPKWHRESLQEAMRTKERLKK